MLTLTLTLHALKRVKQRGISLESIMDVIKYGDEKRFQDDITYNLTPNSISEAKKDGIDLKNIIGLRVVTTINNYIKTAYRLYHLNNKTKRGV